MSFFGDLRHTPANTKPPGTTPGAGDDPLLNLSIVQSRMDSLQRFLSDSVNSNTLLGQHQMDLISNEITSAIQQVFVSGAALLASTQSSNPPPSPLPPSASPSPSEVKISLKPNHKRTFSESESKSEVLEGEDGSDWEIMELDAVELLAEHIHFCDFCGKGFKRDANLRMHMRAHGNQYKTPEALAKPGKRVGSGTDTDPITNKVRFSCPFEGCNRNKAHAKFRPLKSVICVKNHFKRSHCPKMYTCTRCNKKSFSVLADLKSHLKHCGEVKWKCTCGTSFSRKDKLFGHMALFEGHMPAVEPEEELAVPPPVPAVEMGMNISSGSSTGLVDTSDGFLDSLVLDGFDSIDNYCFEDLLEESSSTPNLQNIGWFS